jgi:hypothetical protein
MFKEPVKAQNSINVLPKKALLMPFIDDMDIEPIFVSYTRYFNDQVEISESNKIKGQSTIRAKSELPPGTLIFVHTDQIKVSNTRTSIQIGNNQHVEPGPYGSYTNHSCEPNAMIVSRASSESGLAAIALITFKPVKKGEEITFDYASTESRVTASAKLSACLCGSANCRGKIGGFHEITEAEQQRLIKSGLVADYLVKQMLLKEKNAKMAL